MSDEFDPVEAIREAAGILSMEWAGGPGFSHNADRKVLAMLRGADQLAQMNAHRADEPESVEAICMECGKPWPCEHAEGDPGPRYEKLSVWTRHDDVEGDYQVYKRADGTEYRGDIYGLGAGE